ncbi:MAG: M20/M25/M40 family metallo-hydrolase [Acidobacteria bacterium]|nr:M20/M25/M40 family metallo-hydrolase [Acidobacteriota bacterium]
MDLLRRLVQTSTVNPSLTPGAPGEAPAVAILESLLRDRAELHRLEATPGRPTLVAIRRGRGAGRSLLFNAHTDTVGVENMADPFSGRIAEGRLYGRGSYDMKAGLAAAVEAFLEASPLAGDLLLAAVADEEFASLGTEELLRHFRADACIVTEPTALDLCVAHKGFAWYEITVEGRAAHGSRPDLGIDANLLIAPVLEALGRIRFDTVHPLLGRGSLHISTIRGGTAWSTYADRCVIQVERRLVPGESPDESIFAAASPHAVRRVFHRPPFAANPETTFGRITFEALAAARGTPPGIAGQTPWFDAALLAEAGIETLIVGHGGGGAHAAEEWADLESVDKLKRTLVQIAKQWCNLPPLAERSSVR